MVHVYRFAAVRPERGLAPAIASVPYDVVTADEARAIITRNPQSFLRISRSDAELPGIPPDDDRVYQRARDNFLALISSGRMIRDPSRGMYVYRVIQEGDTYLGLSCCLDVADYRANHIRRHEQTRYDKELDRTRHIRMTRTHNGPVVLVYRDDGGIHSFIDSLVLPGSVPDGEVITAGGTIHQIFRISEPAVLSQIELLFSHVPDLYIADGHHRAKSAVNVADMMQYGHENLETNRFLGVLFAHNHVRIHGYSRLLTELAPYTAGGFLDTLKTYFSVTPYGDVTGSGYHLPPMNSDPARHHIVHLYLGGQWFECSRPIEPHIKALESLDVFVLQMYVFEGMLGISDPRGDARLQYLGGARPIRDLMQLVDSGEYALAFAMQPIPVNTVLAIADANDIMPPKSTWFEPKLLSGLLVHTFE